MSEYLYWIPFLVFILGLCGLVHFAFPKDSKY
jgi:hypothetical protein